MRIRMGDFFGPIINISNSIHALSDEDGLERVCSVENISLLAI